MNKSFSKIRHIQEANQRLEKRLISEQSGTTVTQDNENPPKNQNPFSKEKLDKFKGNTVNIYTDPENKKFKRQIRIDHIDRPKYYDPVNNLGKIEIGYRYEDITGDRSQTIRGGDDVLYLEYSCDKPNKLFSTNTKLFTGPDRFVYSNLFTDKLKKEFCTVGSGGSSVPKATFASTGKPQPSNLA